MDNNIDDRYKLIYNEDELGHMIIDTEEFLSDEIHDWNLLCDLLNNQDKKIKELEEKIKKNNRQLDLTIKYKKDLKEFADRLYEENKQLKKQLENLQKLNGEIITLNRTVIKDSQILEKEIQQLLQS